MSLTTEQKNLLAKKFNINFSKTSTISKVDYSRPIGFKMLKPSILETTPQNYQIPRPGRYQVQIKVESISLNFRDLMIFLGLYPQVKGLSSLMGSDYCGVVVACGRDVEDFEVGDKVIAIHGGEDNIGLHFVDHINAFLPQVVKQPANLTPLESCCIPTVFITSYLGLHRVGNLTENEKVLIHNASGGVGLAAIQVAQWLKAEIYATAGTDKKREYLQTLGIKHIMNSRDLSFYKEILNQTKNRGVDVVLNTLSGEGMIKGLKILKNFGRFIHLDKKDIFQNNSLDLGIFQSSKSFTYFDISQYFLDMRIKQVLEEIIQLFESNIFSSLPMKAFAFNEPAKALNYMAMSQHVGKIVLDFAQKSNHNES